MNVGHGVLEHLVNPAFYVPQGQVSGALLGWRYVLPPRERLGWFSQAFEARVSFSAGLVFIGLAMFALTLLLGPIVAAQTQQLWREGKLALAPIEEQEEQRKANELTFADYIPEQQGVARVEPASHEFGLMIPKIGVNSKVIPQVATGDPEVYMPALRQGLAQAAGSVNPGELGDNFIFGHSTDFEWNVAEWNALFYNLKDLEVGDKIYIYREGEVFIYRVTGKEVYEPWDVSFLNPNKTAERLVLQTCWPPGTTAQRLIVFAEPISGSPKLI